MAQPSVVQPSVLTTPTWLTRTLRELAVQDWLVLLYNFALVFAAWQGTGPLRDACLSRTIVPTMFLIGTLLVVRGGILRDRFVGPMLYRLAVYGTVQLSYFVFRDLLPTANSGTHCRTNAPVGS